MVLETAVAVSLFAAGAFLLCGLLTGCWKFIQTAQSEDGQAHPYVDIAHRASLLYSFASLVLAALVYFSPFSRGLQLFAVLSPLFFFTLAVATYIFHGFRQDTENQFRPLGAATSIMMILLIVGEIAGVGILLWGFILSQKWIS
jgi:hypothetical protein